MKVTNPGPAVVVAGEYEVDAGETVDLPGDIAKSLIRQGWKKARETTETEEKE